MRLQRGRLLILTALTLVLLPRYAGAQGWTEPPIGPVLMTAPLTPPPVTGTTFYVDKSNLGGTCNNANPGTLTQPWCTIAKAMATLTAGQRAYIRAGTYTEGLLKPTNNGTAGNYITFQAYPGDAQPVINCTGQTWCLDQFSGGVQRAFIVINGLNIFGASQEIMSQLSATTSHHWWFVNNKIHDNNATLDFPCLRMGGANNVISNNEGYNCRANFVGAGTTGGTPTNHTAHDNIIEFNNIHGNGRYANDEGAVKCGVHSHACVIRYNTAYDNWRNPSSPVACAGGNQNCIGISGLYMDIDQNSNFGTVSYMYNNLAYNNDTGLQAFGSQQVRIFNNIAYHNGWTAGQALGWSQSNYGHGIMVGLAAEAQDNQIYNNVVYDNWSRGFNLGNLGPTQLTTRNNIAMNNGIGVDGADFASYGFANNNFQNDVMFNNVGGKLIVLNGVLYNSLAAVRARGGNTTWLAGVNANPQFVNTATGDFHLQTSSPAKDEGVTVSLFNYDYANQTRPQGGAWDAGAYEFSAGTPPLSPPTNVRVTSP